MVGYNHPDATPATMHATAVGLPPEANSEAILHPNHDPERHHHERGVGKIRAKCLMMAFCRRRRMADQTCVQAWPLCAEIMSKASSLVFTTSNSLHLWCTPNITSTEQRNLLLLSACESVFPRRAKQVTQSARALRH